MVGLAIETHIVHCGSISCEFNDFRPLSVDVITAAVESTMKFR